jgi:hypothetical protein
VNLLRNILLRAANKIDAGGASSNGDLVLNEVDFPSPRHR